MKPSLCYREEASLEYMSKMVWGKGGGWEKEKKKRKEKRRKLHGADEANGGGGVTKLRHE